MTRFPKEKKKDSQLTIGGDIVPGSSCDDPSLVDTTLLTGGLLWQEHFLSSPGDLLLRPQALNSQCSLSWTLETCFQKFQCLVSRQIATIVCPNVLEKVVKTRLIMVSQVYISSCNSHLNVTLIPNPVQWLTNEKSPWRFHWCKGQKLIACFTHLYPFHSNWFCFHRPESLAFISVALKVPGCVVVPGDCSWPQCREKSLHNGSITHDVTKVRAVVLNMTHSQWENILGIFLRYYV